MKLYRINKVAKPGGVTIKKKHVLTSSNSEAVKRAAESPDCPICDVLRDGQFVGSVVSRSVEIMARLSALFGLHCGHWKRPQARTERWIIRRERVPLLLQALTLE